MYLIHKAEQYLRKKSQIFMRKKYNRKKFKTWIRTCNPNGVKILSRKYPSKQLDTHGIHDIEKLLFSRCQKETRDLTLSGR